MQELNYTYVVISCTQSATFKLSEAAPVSLMKVCDEVRSLHPFDVSYFAS